MINVILSTRGYFLDKPPNSQNLHTKRSMEVRRENLASHLGSERVKGLFPKQTN